MYLNLQMEKIVEKMQEEEVGVPVKTVKSFMSKIPSVFTGVELATWMIKNLDIEDQSKFLNINTWKPVSQSVLTL